MLVNYSLIFISLLLFAGIAVDVGMLERSYLRLQGSAKAAALAASVAKQRGGSSSTMNTAGQTAATANGYVNGVNNVTVTIENPPTSGSYVGNSSAIRAIITRKFPGTFLAILGLGSLNMQAQALEVAPTVMSLTSAFNVNAIFTDGTPISSGGFDNSSYAYSATALGQVRASNNLGALQSWRGNIFFLGPPNAASGVSNKTFSLTAGNYSQMLLLAGTGFGPLSGQTFVVTYTDGTTTSATFNMSDWCNAMSYAGETVVSSQPYRNTGSSTSTQNFLPTYIYGYSINLNSAKTLSTLKLPAVRNVVLLALDLKP